MKLLRAAIILVLSALAASAARDRITTPVDPNQTFQLSARVRPEVQPQFDQGPLDPARRLSRVTLFLAPAAGLDAFLAELQMPGSPNYRRWLKPEEFADRFGATSHDIAALTAWLTAQGLAVDDVARGRHWITFSGSAGRIGSAFRAPIHRFRVNGADHFSNTTAPSVPAAFREIVAGIRGLDDFGLHSLALPAARPDYNVSGSHQLAPEDVANIYHIQALYQAGFTGAGQTIAIVGQSDFNASDIRAFRQRFGLPANDPQKVIFGANPGILSDLSNQLEVALDLEWSGAIAPQATIIYALSQEAFLSLEYAIDQNLAPVVSVSFGGCELYQNAGFLRGVLQQANAQGITVLVASGDQGAATCDSTSPTPQATKGVTESWPASAPEVTAVGGTAFSDSIGGPYWSVTNDSSLGSALGYIPEVVWNDSISRNQLAASGGGPSGFFAKPFWQVGAGVPNDGARDVPDLALAASTTKYPFMVTSNGSTALVGGTSAAAPIMAGILALVNQYLGAQGLGNINPTLYRMAKSAPAAFHDIASGNNMVPCEQSTPQCANGLLGFSAGAGYDQATGLGSVDAYKLATLWSTGAASTTTATATPASGSTTSSIQLSATVSAASGSGAAPTGIVTFLANGMQLGSAPLLASGSSATTAFSVPGVALGGGSNTVIAYYAGDTVYQASSGSAPVSIQASGAGSLVVASVSPNPVPQSGLYWTYNVTLSERRGVATTLTSWSVNGVPEPVSLFSSAAIPANGAIATNLIAEGVPTPITETFLFNGKDADGTAWTAQASVQLTGAQGPQLEPSVQVSLPSATIYQQPSADPSCQFPVPLTVQESGGYLMRMTALTIGGAYTGNIQQIFGTTRLAPYGMVQGTACLSGTMAAGAYPVRLSLTSVELGTTMTASFTVTLAPASASATAMTATPTSVALVADKNGLATATIALAFASGSPAWTASVSPSNGTASWLTVTPLAGNGSATLSLSANGSALSNGAYRAAISIQSANGTPQVLQIPVTLVVGTSATMSIGGVANNFTGATTFSPGMQVAVYGTNLAPTTAVVSKTPLPEMLNGVTVTVNGITAPFYYESSAQLDVQIPYETQAGPAILAVNNNGQVAAFPLTISVTAPGAVPFAVDNTTGQVVTSATPGQILLAFVTGEGDCTPFLATGATPAATAKQFPSPILPVSMTVGGVPVPSNLLYFAGVAPGLVGVTQIDFAVPASAPLGPQQVVVTVGGVATQVFMLTVLAPQ